MVWDTFMGLEIGKEDNSEVSELGDWAEDWAEDGGCIKRRNTERKAGSCKMSWL